MGITDYLHQVATLASDREDWRYASYEELVLDYGTLYTEARVEVSGPIKECFTNAWHAAMDNGWLYVEGYANSIIPVAHAWCIDDEGVVVETTWEQAGSEYYGVALDPRWVGKVAAETGYWSVFGNDWMRKCVLLREGIPIEAMAVEV